VREIKDATQKTPDDCDAIKDLNDAVRSQVEYRIKLSDAVRIATLLDPSVKHVILASPVSSMKQKACYAAAQEKQLNENGLPSHRMQNLRPVYGTAILHHLLLLQTLNQLCLLHLSVKKTEND
jgi:hypothetical protein